MVCRYFIFHRSFAIANYLDWQCTTFFFTLSFSHSRIQFIPPCHVFSLTLAFLPLPSPSPSLYVCTLFLHDHSLHTVNWYRPTTLHFVPHYTVRVENFPPFVCRFISVVSLRYDTSSFISLTIKHSSVQTAKHDTGRDGNVGSDIEYCQPGNLLVVLHWTPNISSEICLCAPPIHPPQGLTLFWEEGIEELST